MRTSKSSLLFGNYLATNFDDFKRSTYIKFPERKDPNWPNRPPGLVYLASLTAPLIGVAGLPIVANSGSKFAE